MSVEQLRHQQHIHTQPGGGRDHLMCSLKIFYLLVGMYVRMALLIMQVYASKNSKQAR